MATDVMPREAADEREEPGRPGWSAEPSSWQHVAERVLGPLASLKLTVVLMALAIMIIFFGTLAQVYQDIWTVIGQYFRTAFAWVEFRIFFPRSWWDGDVFINLGSYQLRGFYFPGGWLIGSLMAVNLLAAHLVRFKVQARGARLATGLMALVAAVGVTWWIIAHTSLTGGGAGDTATDAEFWHGLWTGIKVALAALVVAGTYRLVFIPGQTSLGWSLLLCATVAVAVLVTWLQAAGIDPDPSAMRILWQLILGSVAGSAVFGASLLVFKQRAGIVVIHAGVALMMFNELFVGMTNIESQMTMREGEARNFAEDIRASELAIVDPSDPRSESVTVVPGRMLVAGETIHDASLPFDIEVRKFFPNAALTTVIGAKDNLATAGAGLGTVAVETRAGVGADADSNVDRPAAYVTLRKPGGESLGTRLVGVELVKPEQIEVDGKTYELSLRFKREYKPYVVRLDSVNKTDYAGTDTPRDYSSFVDLIDKPDSPRRLEMRQKRIWMNNPLRYQGETFYQTNFLSLADGSKYSTITVVTNRAWMIPYVGCMIVVVGLLAHFLGTLTRFARRRSPAAATLADKPAEALLIAESVDPRGGKRLRDNGRNGRSRRQEDKIALEETGSNWRYVPFGLVAAAIVCALVSAIPPSEKAGQFDYYHFGQLPVYDGGRIKPFDTLAENTLRAISDKGTFKDAEGHSRTATQWLLDAIADPQAGDEHRVFKITNPEVQSALNLKPRPDYLYSLSELEDHFDALAAQIKLALDAPQNSLSLFQNKILALGKQITMYRDLQAAFIRNPYPQLPPMSEMKKALDNKDTAALEPLVDWKQRADKLRERLEGRTVPMAVPSADREAKGDESWQILALAHDQALADVILPNRQINPAVKSLDAALGAYAAHDTAKFNAEVARYQDWLQTQSPVKGADLGKTNFEAYFNQFSPFYSALCLYLFAMILAFIGLLGFGFAWGEAFQRAAFWIIVAALLIHGWGLVARMQISGRPPVTNLYSAAVFIGFGAVLLCLGMEAVYSLGFGNVVGGAAGFAALLIAQLLVSSTDTLGPLQAVLDTQFWLATHVVCITLGYATTFVAGLLGLVYVGMGTLGNQLNAPITGKIWDTTGLRSLLGAGLDRRAPANLRSTTIGKELTRMIYATVCFSIFFSFFGTVLGGLWADDSWGRFWGWDPKENGALIIVLWNALVLHARWGGMVKDRGLALLAVAGNITVAWSMFGVNELGAGLHSYGFTEGVAIALWGAVLVHLAIIAAAALTPRYWRRAAT